MGYEEPEGAIGYTGPLPDYLDTDEPMEDTQFYSDEKVTEKEFSGEVEDDPEMAEMLKMLEDAKGDLEGAQEKDLAKLMESLEGEEEVVAKPGVKRKSVNQGGDQVVPKLQDDEAKKQRVIGVMSGIVITPDAEEVPVSFDDDIRIETIPTPTKDRAPPPKNRRPPTRSSRKPGCDNNEDDHPQQNGSDSINQTLPSPSPQLKKKKKLKKKAPAGGVAMFGGVDLFGGKNPFAGRKQDVSSSEDESSIDQQQTNNKAEMKLPFGTADASSQQTCDHVMTSKQKAEQKAKEEEEKKKQEESEERRNELEAKKKKKKKKK